MKSKINDLIAAMGKWPSNFAMREEYTLQHVATKMEIWVGNGRGFVRIHEPQKIAMTGCERRKFWKAYQRWQDVMKNRMFAEASRRSPRPDDQPEDEPQ